jgi:hypothetical protein
VFEDPVDMIQCSADVGYSAPSLLDVDRSTWARKYAPLLTAAQIMEATDAA